MALPPQSAPAGRGDGGATRHGGCVHLLRGAGDEEAAAEVAVEWLVVGVVFKSSGIGKRKSKRRVAAAGPGGATILPDAAEALNKARHFVEKAGGDGRGRVATGEAVASLPVELRSLVQRAFTSDKVAGKSEHRACRRELPAVVLRMRDSPARDIARALENHMSADMSGFSELPRPMAEALAHRIRRMDLSLEKATLRG